jgi:cadmium resistance protein CadD (predicted permease)
VLPIALTELLFPRQRTEPWLDRRGFATSAAIFLLSSIWVWWHWSHVGVLQYGPGSYQVPEVYVGLALVVIATLVGATLRLHLSRAPRKAKRQVWPAWLLGLMAFGHSLAWFYLIALAYVPASTLPGVSAFIPIGIGATWVGLGLLVVRYQSRSRGWGDRHRLAVITGASLAGMLGGVSVVLSASPLDQIGKLVFDLIAILLFTLLARRLRRRPSQEDGYASISSLGSEP